MKFGIIIETKEFEKAWNAFRFANSSKSQGHEVKVFLMGEAVECQGLIHEKYNVDEQLRKFRDSCGDVLACGTCLNSRQMQAETCDFAVMTDCVDMVVWADKVITF